MSKTVTINELKVLKHLASLYNEDGAYVGFAPIVKATKIERRLVRLACRSLARKGYAAFGKGLWTDGGEMAGAGYAATKAGFYIINKGLPK